MKKYYIYYIPSFIHKDGSIGKIGCTSIPIKKRAEQQGYSDVELLEEHTDIDIASYREIELQIQYFDKRDNINNYKIAIENRPIWNDSTRHIFTKEELTEAGKKGGRIQGKINVETGHWNKVQSMGGKIGGKISGKINANKINTCPYCNITMQGLNYNRWHGDNCKHKV